MVGTPKVVSCGVAGVDVLWRFLGALRRHLRRIRRAGDTTRPEQFALKVIFRFRGLNAVFRRLSAHTASSLALWTRSIATKLLRRNELTGQPTSCVRPDWIYRSGEFFNVAAGRAFE
jgi:hypothetical protein